MIYYFWVLYSGKGITNAEQKEYFMRLTGFNPVYNSQLAILQQRDTADSASDSPLQIFCKMTTKPIVPEPSFFSRN